MNRKEIISALQIQKEEMLSRVSSLDKVIAMFKQENEMYDTDSIVNIILKYRGQKLEDITGKSRERGLVYTRQLISYFLMLNTSIGCVNVGKIIKRDYTSVLHGRDQINDLIFSDPEVKKDVESLKEIFNQGIKITA